MAKKKQNSALTWILKEAKRLRTRDGHRREWKQYVKQASAIYAHKHKGKSPVGKPHKKVSGVKKSKRISGNTTKSRSHVDNNKFRNLDISIGAVRQHIAVAKKGLEGQLSAKMLQQYKATTKTHKRKLGKEIAALKSKIRKLT